MRRRAFLTAALGSISGTAQTQTWQRRRIGANCFNRRVSPQWLEAAAAANISLVRLVYEKWGERDFLLLSADEYRALLAPHLRQLVAVLDGFYAKGIAVVLTPITLPGARWRQQNGNRRDGRLWKETRYWDQARRFWRDLTRALKQHPAIAAFDLLNEPAPELEHGKSTFWTDDYRTWYNTVRGTAGDLNAFYRHLVEGIREVDTRVPLILESGLHATPWALDVMEPFADPNIRYSIHMYEPYEYTTWRKHKGALKFPGSVPIEGNDRRLDIDAAWLNHFFDPVRAWMTRHSLPPGRLIIGEFGCGRRCPGAAEYLAALVRIFDREDWHWMFYSFREDTWDGMDYELGVEPPPPWYWDLAEKDGLPERYDELYARRRENALWRVLQERLRSDRQR